MSMFERYVGIDYSGMGLPHRAHAQIQTYWATHEAPPTRKQRPNSTYNWSRRSLAEWLLRILAEPTPTIVGIDHAFSFPFEFLRQHDIGNLEAFLAEFSKHWPTDSRAVHGLKQGNQLLGGPTMFRLTDRSATNAKSVFRFGVEGEVATSTHAGIPWLKCLRNRLRNQVHFWPFDGLVPAAGRSVVAEVYPRLFRPDYDRPVDLLSDHEYDAWMVCSWLRDVDMDDELGDWLALPLSREKHNTVRMEGWMLGLRAEGLAC